MEKRPLFLFAGGFVLGEVLGLHNQTAVRILAAAVFTAAIGWMMINSDSKKVKKTGEGYPQFLLRLRKKSRVRKTGLLLFFILCGVIRGGWERQIWEKETAFDLDGETCGFVGVVEGIRESKDRYELLLRPAVSERGESLRGLLVYVDRSLAGEPAIGFRVLVKGKVRALEAAGNQGQFDYRSYYRAQKLGYRMSAAECDIVDRRQRVKDRYQDALRRLSAYFGDILDESADEQDAGVLKSMLLGDKSGLDPEVRDRYQRNGIAHLLAISGLHLSLISMAVYGMLRRTGSGYGVAGVIGGFVLIGFCVMTGASASSIRALVMVLCGYLAAYLGRTYDVLTALGLAGILILWDSPWQLTQSGVQLSFAAVAGIAAVQESKTLPVPVALQAATVPVILYHYFQLPLYGILLNLLVLPLVGGVVGSGSLTILCGLGNRTAARFPAGTAHVILLWYDWLCRWFQKLPGANLVLGRPAAWQIGVYYGGLIIWFYCLKWFEAGQNEEIHDPAKKEQGERICFQGTETDRVTEKIRKMVQKMPGTAKKLVILCVLMLVLRPLPIRDLRVTFLDVGQGDGIFLRGGHISILVDGGSSSVSDPGEDRLEPYLKSQGLTEVDFAIVSHGDQDHINGLEYLLGEESDIRIQNLVLPAAGRGDEVYEELCEKAAEKETQIFWMEAGDRIEQGGLKMICLYPEDAQGSPSEERNDHSLVIRCDYGDFHMLLTGDMSMEGEKEILSKSDLRNQLADICTLKIAHHGSATASGEEWLDAVSPLWAVISYGKDNRYGHPDAGVIEALTKRHIIIFQTALDGAVTLCTDGENIEWSTFLKRENPD